jgi:Mg-chelatase subunit ChlD
MSAAAPAPLASAPVASLSHGITATAYQLSTGEALVRIQGEAREAHVETHTILLLDLSGSMKEGGKLANVTRSLHFMLDLMMPSDRISLVTFENDAQVRFSRLALTAENKEAVRITLGRLAANGGTNLSAGIVSSRECLFASSDVGAQMKQGILLLTDGHANVGVYDPASINRHVGALLADYPGLTVSTIGYGTDHNADLLSQIATQGSGSYNVVGNIEDVATVFGDILGGFQTCIAQQMKLLVPSAAVTQLTPFLATTAENVTTITLGDLPAGGEHVVLLNGLAPSAGVPLTIRAYEMETGRPVEIAIPIRTDITAAEETFGRITLLRISVVAFLTKVKDSLFTLTAEARVTLRLEQQTLLAAIDAQIAEPTPLLTLLKDELIAIEVCLTAPATAPVLRARASVLAQHTSHLGACRGVRANATVMLPDALPMRSPAYLVRGGAVSPGMTSGPPSDALSGGNPTNIFATVTQTQRSMALRASSSAVPYAPHPISMSTSLVPPSGDRSSVSVSAAVASEAHTASSPSAQAGAGICTDSLLEPLD